MLSRNICLGRRITLNNGDPEKRDEKRKETRGVFRLIFCIQSLSYSKLRASVFPRNDSFVVLDLNHRQPDSLIIINEAEEDTGTNKVGIALSPH
jgi:hypothetical protein